MIMEQSGSINDEISGHKFQKKKSAPTNCLSTSENVTNYSTLLFIYRCKARGNFKGKIWQFPYLIPSGDHMLKHKT